MNIKPYRIFPGYGFALMWGQELRYEFIGGQGSIWVKRSKSSLWWLWKRPGLCYLWERPALSYPYESDRLAVITHLQKRMKWGVFLTTGPKSWGLHLWF